MLNRNIGFLLSFLCAVFLTVGCTAASDCLTYQDMPCTVRVSGVVIDGTAKTPLASVDVRLELYSPGDSSPHSSVSQRTDEKGKFELEILYEDVEDRCFVTVPATSHLGISYQEYRMEIQLLKDNAGYDAENSYYSVGNLLFFLARE